MFDVNNWLNRTLPNGRITKEYLCFLIFANGGFDVTGWGFISTGLNFHQRGLEQNEALDLIRHSAFIEGLVAAGIDFHSVFKPIYEEYCKQVENKA